MPAMMADVVDSHRMMTMMKGKWRRIMLPQTKTTGTKLEFDDRSDEKRKSNPDIVAKRCEAMRRFAIADEPLLIMNNTRRDANAE